MKDEVSPETIAAIKQFFNERYGGDTTAFAKRLDDAIFMLFFLEERAFTRERIQQVGYELKTFRDVLTDAQSLAF